MSHMEKDLSQTHAFFEVWENEKFSSLFIFLWACEPRFSFWQIDFKDENNK